ncbi:uncharacterized protein LOC142985743 [Anticarsia gemmatalis]|uniref:uncharacterized protein LOC142985743 n=1 Tax=Anticarsia gemmatalis TaxID=129554 RepID=UPI003F767FD7
MDLRSHRSRSRPTSAAGTERDEGLDGRAAGAPAPPLCVLFQYHQGIAGTLVLRAGYFELWTEENTGKLYGVQVEVETSRLRDRNVFAAGRTASEVCHRALRSSRRNLHVTGFGSANHGCTSRAILLSTALVQVMDHKGKPHTARVLLDNGSTANLISEDVVHLSFSILLKCLTQRLLFKKRASIKAKLTQFSSYLEISRSCEKLSEVQLVEVEYRLNIFENLYEKYDTLQNQLEELADEPSEQYAEREQFESQFANLVASARQLLHSTRNINVSSLQRFRRIEYLKQHFWVRFSHEYVVWLQERTKWRRSSGELKEGTLVVIKDKSSPPLMWLLGRIIRVLPGRDGVARVADIRTRKGVIRRAFNTICALPISSVEKILQPGQYVE